MQPFCISGPHWKNCRLGPHIKYIVTSNHKKSHNVLSKFMIFWGCVHSHPGHPIRGNEKEFHSVFEHGRSCEGCP